VTLDDAEFRTHVQPPLDAWMGGDKPVTCPLPDPAI
jgi:hypothetical protein